MQIDLVRSYQGERLYDTGLKDQSQVSLVESSICLSIFIRPSSDGTYYGMVMSVRVSVRPTLRPISVRPCVRPGLRPPVFRTFLLHALTYWTEILHMTLF